MLKICMWFFQLMTCRTSYSWFLPLTFCQCNNRSLFWRNLTAISVLNIVNCFVNTSSENWSKNVKQKATWASFLCTERASNALHSRNVYIQLLTSLVESKFTVWTKLRFLSCKKFLCRASMKGCLFQTRDILKQLVELPCSLKTELSSLTHALGWEMRHCHRS